MIQVMDDKSLEMENRRLLEVIAEKDREIERLIKRENEFWITDAGRQRHTSGLPPDMVQMMETMDRVIGNDETLYRFTRLRRGEFEEALARFDKIVKNNPDAPHFRDDESKKSDAGNQCILHIRHTFLMSLIRRALNMPQFVLGEMFRIDQTTVSRYLKFVATHDDDTLLVTPHNITKLIKSTDTIEELKDVLPGRQGGEVIADGTLVETTRPQNSSEQKKQYSGKGKMFAISTTALINKHGYVVGITDSREGSCHDIRIFRENMPDFGTWLDKMQDSGTPKAERIQIIGDSGYQGLSKYFAGTDERVPYKKPKNKELSKTKRAYNKTHYTRRIKIENVFAHVKNWTRISGIYDGTTQEFNDDFNAICGMYNMRKMHRDGTYHIWKDKILRMESYKGT